MWNFHVLKRVCTHALSANGVCVNLDHNICPHTLPHAQFQVTRAQITCTHTPAVFTPTPAHAYTSHTPSLHSHGHTQDILCNPLRSQIDANHCLAFFASKKAHIQPNKNKNKQCWDARCLRWFALKQIHHNPRLNFQRAAVGDLKPNCINSSIICVECQRQIIQSID